MLVGAWMLKLALADAYAMAATLLAYHRSTEGMTPDPAWKAKLDGMSDDFRTLKDKAQSAIRTPGMRASNVDPDPGRSVPSRAGGDRP